METIYLQQRITDINYPFQQLNVNLAFYVVWFYFVQPSDKEADYNR